MGHTLLELWELVHLLDFYFIEIDQVDYVDELCAFFFHHRDVAEVGSHDIPDVNEL